MNIVHAATDFCPDMAASIGYISYSSEVGNMLNQGKYIYISRRSLKCEYICKYIHIYSHINIAT